MMYPSGYPFNNNIFFMFGGAGMREFWKFSLLLAVVPPIVTVDRLVPSLLKGPSPLCSDASGVLGMLCISWLTETEWLTRILVVSSWFSDVCGWPWWSCTERTWVGFVEMLRRFLKTRLRVAKMYV